MKLNQQLEKAATAHKNKDYKNAISYYLLIQPETVDTMLGVATSYQELGDREKAIEYFKFNEIEILDSINKEING